MKFWLFRNERLAEALTEFENEFPVLNMYLDTVVIYGDIVVLSGETAGFCLEEYLFNEAGGEALELNEFLGDGWYIRKLCANYIPRDPRDLFIEQEGY